MAAGGAIRIVSPVDGRVYAERGLLDGNALEWAVALARAAQPAWRHRPISERAAICSAAVDAMLAMTGEIVPELAWQMGRPVGAGGGEMKGFEERARHMIAVAEAALAPIEPQAKAGFRRYVVREPLGVVLVVAPWNYPYLTAVNAVIPALMAGNAVLLKPASQTFLTGDRFKAAFERAGLPEGLFQPLALDHGMTERLIASGRVDHVGFTGSVDGGRRIEAAASGTFKGVGLELGGKDPAYVRADADLALAVEGLVDGAFFNAGQSCCAIERIYVDRAVFEPFIGAFVEATKGHVLGSPLDEATTLGPMVRASAADFVRGQVAEAVAAGARALIDPKGFPADAAGSPYMAPQVLIDVDHDMRVMKEESFGPVVGIMPVADEAEAVALMNDSPYGLTASVWTTDLEAAERIGAALDTGTVFMNRCDYLDPGLAWTGTKDSGRGATLSVVGYAHLTRPKSFHLRHGATP
ncbi:MAG: aldehyde dehydrogenase family protein [Geminicoccaceae bacterium]|nr:aldehyde dehydrogenase family protein [Geminicoccaceae bacterium]